MKLNPLKKFLKLNLKQNSIVALTVFLAFNSWAHSKPMDIYVSSKDQIVSFDLSSNPTTGFRWQILKYDTKVLKLLSRKYEGSKPRLIGSGGKENFQFKILKKPVNTIIDMSYSRPWEKGQGLPQQIHIISKD